MNKVVSVIITIGLLIALGIVFWGGGEKTPAGNNVAIKDGVQYVTINARGGYSPRVSTAQADIPTKLIMKTNGTYDCSASLLVRSAEFQQILPQTGETEIDLGIPKAGVPVQGVCGMGMYSFQVDFEG